MKLFVTAYNDARLLPHFLRHYSAIGVTHFHVATSAHLKEVVAQGAARHAVTIWEGLDTVDSQLAGTAAVAQMRKAHQGADEWVVIVDLDEFVECADLPAVATEADKAGATVVRGIMHDRFAIDGLPQDFGPDANLCEIFSVKSRFIRNVMKASDHKGVLVKGHLQGPPLVAHHRFNGERLFSRELEISHYKWTPGSIERLRSAHRLVSEAGQAWGVEYQRAIEHFDRHGRFAWETFGGAPQERFAVEPPAAHCADCGGAISGPERDYSTGLAGVPLCRLHQAARGLPSRP